MKQAIMTSSNQNHTRKDEISIVLHIDEDLDVQNKKRVEYQLSRIDGIQGVEFDKFRPHLLFIKFSPFHIESREILCLLRSYNFHVQLIVGD